MATSLRGGPVSIRLSRDSEGYREYKVIWKVKGATGANGDGPLTVLNTPGLPLPGAPYALLNEVDPFVWCRPNAEVKAFGVSDEDGENTAWWTVQQTFSNKPLDPNKERCSDTNVDDPLLEPPKLSGGLVNYQEEATHDRFGRAITTSSWEPIRGAQVEFDASRSRVHIEQNVPVLDLGLVYSMRQTVNAFPLWGFGRRTIKLSDFQWSEHYQGLCSRYYKRVFDFDINPNTWDRFIPDEGTKVLSGHWDETTGEWVLDPIGTSGTPNPYDPRHFIQYKDRRGENARVILNGKGIPAGAVSQTGRRFISITDSNQGNAISDTDNWAPFVFSSVSDVPAQWELSGTYRRGNLVSTAGSYWVAVVDPEVGVSPLVTADWVEIPPATFEDLGFYSAGASYLTGNVVTDTTEEAAGYIYVERYNEANFLLLGIPTFLGP